MKTILTIFFIILAILLIVSPFIMIYLIIFSIKITVKQAKENVASGKTTWTALAKDAVHSIGEASKGSATIWAKLVAILLRKWW